MTMLRPALIAVTAFALGACASTQIGSSDEYERVSMNKVFPYPEEAETSQRQVSVVLSQSYTSELPRTVVGEAMAQAQTTLARFMTEAGAGIADSGIDAGDLFTKGVRSSPETGDEVPPQGPSHALITSFSKYEYTREYAKPVNLFFKSEEEMAKKPGKCTHRVEFTLAMAVYEIPPAGHPMEMVKSFTLADSGEDKIGDLDTSCPYSEGEKRVQFEEVLREALECMELPIRNAFAGSGYITEHRRQIDGNKNVFKTGLGSSRGAQKGLDVEVFRVLVSTAEDGSRSLQEIKIAEGVISNQIEADSSWILIDLEKVRQPILQGDLARIVYRKGLGSNLPGFGRSCSGVLSEHQ